MKKLMILGSVKYFENIVKTAKEMGIYTIVCDNRKHTPAKLICDESIDIDISDIEKLKEIAIEKKINGIVTAFADTLIEPYTIIANDLQLPCVIEKRQIKAVTNKKEMKSIFEKNKIPTSKHVIISDLKEISKIEVLKYPLIIKPVDNAGSKGVFIINSLDEFKKYFNDSQSYSSDGKVIVEEFYESDEIQGLAWVNQGEAHVLYIGDRELVNIHKDRTGKPERLMYPSKYCFQYEDEIKEIYQTIATAFGIKNGPLYIQMLVGSEGIKVGEMMTRLPGGCDYLAIKEISGFNAAELMINFALGNNIKEDDFKKQNMKLNCCTYALPIYIRSGKVDKIKNMNEIARLSFVSGYIMNIQEGDIIDESGDLRQDCGRIFGTSRNIFDAQKKKEEIHRLIDILDEKGESMIENF